MPITIQYQENGGVFVKGEGAVTGSEIKEANDRLYETKDKIRKISYQIVDFTGVENFFVSNPEIDLIAAQDKRAFGLNPDMFIAVVSEQDLIYGLARMWQAMAYAPLFETMVFRKLEDAREWIEAKLHAPVRQE